MNPHDPTEIEELRAQIRREMASEGGKARAAKLKAGEIKNTAGAKPVPTYCAKCGKRCPSATEAKKHPKTEECKERRMR